MDINAKEINYNELNSYIKTLEEKEINIKNVIGQRYIGAGVKNKKISIYGTPGNALGAYLYGSEIYVYGNAQDAIGDTMNSGTIVVNGSCGDATGYAMRGGEIYIKNSAGYRVGIHMKEYKGQKPVIIVGGSVGNFLGEYQAGGVIIILGIGYENKCPVGEFCGTGMHGGNIYIRTNNKPQNLPNQVICEELEDIKEINTYIEDYTNRFNKELYKDLLNSKYYKLSPNTNNPYKQLYTVN